MSEQDAEDPIYLDHHATTPVDPDVLDRMLPFFRGHFGNAASRDHGFGWRAEEAVEAARKQVARLLGAMPREVVFTSGATEADNLAILGVAEVENRKVLEDFSQHPLVKDRNYQIVHFDSPDRRGIDVARGPPIPETGRPSRALRPARPRPPMSPRQLPAPDAGPARPRRAGRATSRARTPGREA